VSGASFGWRASVRAADGQMQRLLVVALGLDLGEHSRGGQPVEHVRLTGPGQDGVGQRVVRGRRLHQAREPRCLRPGERRGNRLR